MLHVPITRLFNHPAFQAGRPAGRQAGRPGGGEARRRGGQEVGRGYVASVVIISFLMLS